MTAKGFSLLNRLHQHGVISHLDYYFAATMAGVFSKDHPLAAISCALVSRALAGGHIRLNIKAVSGSIIHLTSGNGDMVGLPDVDTWTSVLESASMVENSTDYYQTLETHIKEEYGPFMEQKDMMQSLNAMDRFRILCAHKNGEYGNITN